MLRPYLERKLKAKELRTWLKALGSIPSIAKRYKQAMERQLESE
jgi:hypothetical protein